MTVCNVNNIKKGFILLAYMGYVLVTILKNQDYFSIGNYEYIIVFFIGVCLKMASSTEIVEKIVNSIDSETIEEIQNKLNNIDINLNDIKTNSIVNSDRTLKITGRLNNEPINENVIYLDDLINNRRITRDDFIIEIVNDSKEPTPRI
jgi:hypothetical protein